MIQWDKRPAYPVLACFEGASQPLQALLASSYKTLPHSSDGLFHLIISDEANSKVRRVLPLAANFFVEIS
jgi:hypothetical protein